LGGAAKTFGFKYQGGVDFGVALATFTFACGGSFSFTGNTQFSNKSGLFVFSECPGYLPHHLA
jgi:hypothetical protein